jgi:hypothetical protein
MTMVATPGVVGVLQSSAPTSALVMTVDSAYAAYLTSLLVGGAWTYVIAYVGNSAEVIKITGITGQVITVTRGEDNTLALSFAAGALLTFVMGASAVADLIAAAALAPALVLTSTDSSVTITSSSTNNFNLHVPVPAVTSNNASLLVTSSGPSQFDLAINTTAIGYCPSA